MEIQRWSVSDGPGSRTVIFLKGCPLHCPWCANPESQDRRVQMAIFSTRCVRCGACVRECPENVAIPAAEGAFGTDNCTGCGNCIRSCHGGARSWMGEEMTAGEVVDLVKKDMVFYRKSSGGVTFSGGEPLTHPQFLGEIINRCMDLGIHTAVETCGYFDWKAAEKTIAMLDFIMFDLKHMDEATHKRLTGVSNRLILENILKISSFGIPMVIRIPVIPGVNDDEHNIRATAVFVRDHLPQAIGIEALAYHRLGVNKYQALGIEYPLGHIEPPSDSRMAALRKLITDTGVPSITADNDYDAQLVRSRLKSTPKHLTKDGPDNAQT